MNPRKTNPTPDDFVTICSSPEGGKLLRLNVHLRDAGFDARQSSHAELGHIIRVPPHQRERAAKARDAYTRKLIDPVELHHA